MIDLFTLEMIFLYYTQYVEYVLSKCFFCCLPTIHMHALENAIFSGLKVDEIKISFLGFNWIEISLFLI